MPMLKYYDTLTLNYGTLSFNNNILTKTEGQHRQDHTMRPMSCHQWNNCTLNVTCHLDYYPHTHTAKDYWTLSINPNIITNIQGQHMQDYDTRTLNDWTLNVKVNIFTNTEGQYVRDWTLNYFSMNTEGQHMKEYDTLTPNYWTLDHYLHTQLAKDYWTLSVNSNFFTDIEGQHMQEYDTLTLDEWTMNFNFNVFTNTEGQYVQDYTTLHLNRHQWNNCTLDLNCHLDLKVDMNVTLVTSALIINFQAGMGHDTADYQYADPLAERVYHPSRRKLEIDHDVSSTIIQTFDIGKKGKSPTGNVIQDIHACVRLSHCFDHLWRLYLRIGLIQNGTQHAQNIGKQDTLASLGIHGATKKAERNIKIMQLDIYDEHGKQVDAITQEHESYKHIMDSLRKSGPPEDKKCLQGIGSPAPSRALTALEGLYKCDVGGSMKGTIEDIEAETEISKEDILDAINFVRLEKCYDHDKTKLVIGALGAPMWEGQILISRALEAEGQAVHHRDVGPVGWLE
ncbi:unnamed protein product, partial [Prorocentrum cordatum]